MSPNRTSESPLVSVLIPLYNHAAYVEECLESIRAEEWPRLELLVLDDGSKDDSFAVVKKWVKHHHARFERVFLETQSNHGLCFTLNRLIKEARSDYLIICASDDSVTSGGIRHRFQFLQLHPTCLAVFGKVDLIADETKKDIVQLRRAYKRHTESWRNPKLITRQFLLNGTLFGPSTMFRRAAFEAKNGVGLYDENLVLEDIDMNLRLLSRNALCFIDEFVGNYRIPEVRTFFFSPPQDEFHRTYLKFINSFNGLNGMLIRLQIWRSTSGSGSEVQLKRWLGRQMISIFKRIHLLEKVMARIAIPPK